MSDQAESLRLKLKNIDNRIDTKVLAVVSGKGGVGKSNFSLNFAIGLTQAGHKVLVFDLDIGMGNIDILMGVSPKLSIVDMFKSNISIKEIVEEGPNNLSYIAAGTGFSNIFQLDIEKASFLIQQLESLMEDYDYVIFDMGAGVSEETLHIALCVDELIVVTTPEPTSITDAYAMMKYFLLKNQDIPIYILVNQVYSEKQVRETFKRLSKVVKQFLNKEVQYLGDLPSDRVVTKAVSSQIPFLIYDPHAEVSKAMKNIIQRYRKKVTYTGQSTTPFSFISKLKNYILGK